MELHFAGSTPYGYSGEPTGKITVEVEIEGFRTVAVVDTAAPYMICHPEIAEHLRLSGSTSIGTVSLRTHLGQVTGDLHRATITLPATSGASIQLEATVFVPELDQWAENPSFIGFHGCLERIRLAIDPETNLFYFGNY